MKRSISKLALVLCLAAGVAAGSEIRADDDDSGHHYEITITNVTRGQQFTPFLIATHKPSVRLFELGRPASPELQRLAEEGDTAPLAARLSADPRVLAVVTSGPLLDPGASRTVRVRTRGDFDHVSVASMLIPTNDGFLSLNGVQGPRGRDAAMLFSPAYDAGSEVNDETCANIPGPFFEECGGPGGGGSPTGGEEGYVHIHAGIHGIGDMNPSRRDWRNPVVQIVIRRVP